jgi:1-acyl-sn-glycerol-3-phosphate acyltransferase
LFLWLSRFLIKRNFNSVCINGEFADNAKSVLVIANHVSWWDGFWVEYLNQEIIHRKFCFMMLEEQLRKHWYFQYSGGFSVKKKSRTIIESINYSIELLKQPKNLVLMFPQGKIHSMYNDTVNFEKGVERIIKNVSHETQILFVANLIDFFSDNKPKLYIYIKSFLAEDVLSSDIAAKYNNFYRQVINAQKAKIS